MQPSFDIYSHQFSSCKQGKNPTDYLDQGEL